MARRTLTSTLYRAARVSATGRAIRTGTAGRRAKNVAIGRALGASWFLVPALEVEVGCERCDRPW